MDPIKFIQPSQVFFWGKCPLKAVFSAEYKDRPLFPKHPDSELGSLIHLFIQKKKYWAINSEESFEEKWKTEIEKIDRAYLANKLQKIYYPIKWYSKYYSVKKILLKKSLLKESKQNKSGSTFTIRREQWRDDGKDIGGKIDYMVLNEKNEIIEIGDTKTGKIFEFVGKKKVLKEAYIKQLQLYAYIIKCNQDFYPTCFIKDVSGNKYELDIDETDINIEIEKAVALKNRINKCIEESNYSSLANPCLDHCSMCDYRPACNSYKEKYINNLSNKRVDVFGEIVKIEGVDKKDISLKIDTKTITLKGVLIPEKLNIGENIYIFNLFCPENENAILYAIKETILMKESDF
jgi:hypothetical protein